ncbi:hypothetical protein SDC9_180039 [bioreactor metagenome]|uniref:Uncharacterized protein n=1 Tax=bioreactor metagenome TaxID=1076179 RepID=A0A645H1L8_9ZZZZ
MVVARKLHHFLQKLGVIAAQRGILHPQGAFAQHFGLPPSVQHGQAMGALIVQHFFHRGHPPLKQCRHLGIHFVDLRPRGKQLVHSAHPLSIICWAYYTLPAPPPQPPGPQDKRAKLAGQRHGNMWYNRAAARRPGGKSGPSGHRGVQSYENFTGNGPV